MIGDLNGWEREAGLKGEYGDPGLNDSGKRLHGLYASANAHFKHDGCS